MGWTEVEVKDMRDDEADEEERSEPSTPPPTPNPVFFNTTLL